MFCNCSDTEMEWTGNVPTCEGDQDTGLEAVFRCPKCGEEDTEEVDTYIEE